MEIPSEGNYNYLEDSGTKSATSRMSNKLRVSRGNNQRNVEYLFLPRPLTDFQNSS